MGTDRIEGMVPSGGTDNSEAPIKIGYLVLDSSSSNLIPGQVSDAGCDTVGRTLINSTHPNTFRFNQEFTGNSSATFQLGTALTALSYYVTDFVFSTEKKGAFRIIEDIGGASTTIYGPIFFR